MRDFRGGCAGLGAALLVLLSLAWPWEASAQAYPTKPLKLIVPYAPGGGTDISARIAAQKISEGLGQQIVIDNRAGAGGIIGTEAAAKSPPDGYTLVVGTASTLAIAPGLYPNAGYDALNSFVPISLLTTAPFLIVVNAAVPAGSVRELIALAKAKPGQLSFGSAGNGNILHVAGEMFKTQAGVDLLHVPYKGAAPALQDLLAGRIEIMFEQFALFQPHIPAGKVRVLAVAASKRHAQLPDVPTAAEAGVPGFEVAAWFGMLAPKGTAGAIVARLSGEAQKAVASREMQDTLQKLGIEPAWSTPEDFSSLLKAENLKWSQVIKTSRIRID